MDWNKLKAEYIAGGTSYRKLAEKHGVPFGTLKRVAVRDGWATLRAQADEEATTKILETVSTQNADRARKIVDAADKLIDKIIEMVERSQTIDSQSIKHFTSALKDLKEIKGIKSDADMREQEARIENLRRQAEKDNVSAQPIEVVFNAGEEEWNE